MLRTSLFVVCDFRLWHSLSTAGKEITDLNRTYQATTLILYRPQRSLGQGNIFRSVCQEFCPRGRGGGGGGVSASMHAGIHPLEQTPPEQTPPGSRHPTGCRPPTPRSRPPSLDTPCLSSHPLGS